jgi:arylsulfatase A
MITQRLFFLKLNQLHLLFCFLCLFTICRAEQKPNVVLIFIDDMGYGDIGPFGWDHLTPHLDRMAKEGMKLTEFYVSSAACTPSRSALMTGCYADSIGMGQSVVFPADKEGLNPKESGNSFIIESRQTSLSSSTTWKRI